jgi:hypothetical protein
MTNERAIKLIQASKTDHSKAEELASTYAMDDIIFDDINVWLKKPIHSHIEQFVLIGRDVLEDYMCEPLTSEDQQRIFAEGVLGIAESMYHYAKIYTQLKEDSQA